MSQKPQLQIAYTELVNEFLLIKWTNQTESIILSKTLRDNCPCASCAGETDMFGNIYKGPRKQKPVINLHKSNQLDITACAHTGESTMTQEFLLLNF